MSRDNIDDRHLSERINVRFTPNEMAWLEGMAREMDPPVSVSYMVRACVVGFRQITARPLIENLRPLDTHDMEGRRPATTVQIPHRKSRR